MPRADSDGYHESALIDPAPSRERGGCMQIYRSCGHKPALKFG